MNPIQLSWMRPSCAGAQSAATLNLFFPSNQKRRQHCRQCGKEIIVIPSDHVHPQVLDMRAVVWKIVRDGSCTEEKGCYVSHFYT